MIPIKDLLGRAMLRAKVSTQVSASRVVSAANDFLADILKEHRVDARAASFHDQTLTIEGKNASIIQFVHEHETELLGSVQSHVTELPIRFVRYRVVHRFRGSEI